MSQNSENTNKFATPPATEAREIWAVWWPMALEMLAAFGIGLVATAWSNRLGSASAAAFVIAATVHSAVFMAFRVVAAGTSVVVSQRVGAQDGVAVRQLARACTWASLGLGALGALVVALGAPLWVRWVDAGEGSAALAVNLLTHLAPALALDAAFASLAAVARAHVHLRAGRAVLSATLASHVVHLALCALWMPQYGLVGFAWAMLVGRLVGCAALLLVWQRLGLLAATPRFAWRQLAPVVAIGAPALAEGLLYRVAVLVALAAVAQLGTLATAAHGIATQVAHFWVMFTFALGLACEIVVAHAIGAGNLARAHRVVGKSLAAGLCLATVGSVAVALTHPMWLPLLAPDAATWPLVLPLLWLAVVLELGRTCNIVLINALRAAGDTLFPLAAACFSMSLVLALGAWVLGRGLGTGLAWGLVGIWVALAADECVRGALMAWRFRSGRWRAKLPMQPHNHPHLLTKAAA